MPPTPTTPLVLTGGQKTDRDRSAEARPKAAEARVDWFSATLKPTNEAPCGVELVQTAAALALGCALDDWVELKHGEFGYRQAMVGPSGARLMWDAPGRVDVYMSLPGRACAVAGEDRLRTLLRFVANHGHPTRIDITMDDFAHIVKPDQVLAALKGPDAVTHAKKGLTTIGLCHRVSRDDQLDRLRWRAQLASAAPGL